MEKQKQYFIVDVDDIEHIKSAIDNLNDQVLKLLEIRNESPNTYLTTKEACKLLHVTSRTLAKWRQKGIISVSRVGRRIYYKSRDVEDLIERNTLCRIAS